MVSGGEADEASGEPGTALQQQVPCAVSPFESAGRISRLADLGHAPTTYTETARVRPPDDDETLFLHMDPDQRSSPSSGQRTASGRIVEVNDITLPAHQWELVYEWPAG